MILSAEARELLGEMAVRYHAALPGSQALDYLSGRGISEHAIDYFRLGVVDGSYPEHADYVGRIAIPYVTKLGGVVGFKFRLVGDGGGSKYVSDHMSVRPYNTLAFERAEQLGYIGICEGEFDAEILTIECGIPTVGIPGVDTWKAHPEWPLMFDGFTRVYVFPDQDEDRVLENGKVVNPGRDLGNRIKSDLDEAIIINLPAKDVNQTFLEYGADLIRAAAGL